MSEHDHTCGCETKNPLQRDGTSQTERLLSALDPSFVQVDERQIDDLLRFALKYAEKLNFYDNSDNVSGDWYNFLAKDVSVLCANISGADLDPLVKDFRTAFAKIEVMAKEETASDAEVETTLKALYSPLITLINLLGTWHDLCDEKLLLRSDLRLYFTSVFSSGFIRFREIDEATAAEGIIAAPAALEGVSLNAEWTAAISGTVTANAAVFSGLTAATHNSKYALAASFYIRGIFDEFYMALLNIISRAPEYLAKSINEYPWHKAQAGLFLAFIQLFGYAQQHLNKLTQRHLDFYFDRVLQLQRKPAVADSVHLIFELAANVAQYEIPEGTLLKAGKDELGKPLSYSTDDTLVFNKTQAAEFKSIYIQRNEVLVNPSDTSKTEYTRIYASPVANSSDGIGGVLDSELPQWEAFGSQQYFQNSSVKPAFTMPDADVGFAIASPQLILKEGRRTIKLKFKFTNPIPGIVNVDDEINLFTAGLTTAKGWLTQDLKGLSVSDANANVYYSNGTNELTFTLFVDIDQPAITVWNTDVHGGTFDNTTWPVLRMKLNNTASLGNFWAKLQDAEIVSASLSVDVQNVQNIIIQNDQALGDPAKPFQPFGVQAPKNSAFYIGSDEIFYKTIEELKVAVNWHETPAKEFQKHYETYFTLLDKEGLTTIANNYYFTVKAQYLNNREWINCNLNDIARVTKDNPQYNPITNPEKASIKDSLIELFLPTAANQQLFVFQSPAGQKNVFNTTLPDSDDYTTLTDYNATVQRGFIRFVLDNDFLHNKYAAALMQAVKDPKNPVVVNPPYTPLIKGISLSYKSSRDLVNTHDQFFRIHPFGEERVTIVKKPSSKQVKQPIASSANIELADEVLATPGMKLLPQYTINESLDSQPNPEVRRLEGMLFIGLSKLVPPQSISMLVQTVDDSADPNQNQPPILWSYLRNNQWIELDQSLIISDTTNGFINSGLIELGIPQDATNNNTLLTPGLHWLRAATVLKENAAVDGSELITPGSTSALSNVLNIHTQAIKASFRDNGNDPNHLRTSLTAETISKLENSISAVKSVKQPYASFGGKLSEAGNEYYRRVSERLRHKGRAITMWDYERLVLENHPSIYKVKCINHMRYRSVNSEPCYNQMAGGGVTVIVVSNLRNQNLVNPLQPTTSNAMRTEIETMLNKRSSRFVDVKVINPKYEEIFVKFKVYFGKQWSSDKGYYSTQLNEDIKKFLSPWAYEEGADIRFGGKLHASFILNFIEEREYVDYITDFALFKLDENGVPGLPLEEISASEVYSILVSAPQHEISY
jgi:Baseplate J-like protein